LFINNNIVVYEIFNILEKLDYCSLVEYKTAYGVINTAIVLNSVNRIIYIFKEHNLNTSENQILEKFNDRFNLSINEETFGLLGEYKINDSEYIINIHYKVIINVFRSRKKKIHRINVSSYGLETLSTPIITVINETTKQKRMEDLKHEIVEFNNKNIILYDAQITLQRDLFLPSKFHL